MVDIDIFVNEDFCNEDVVVSSILKKIEKRNISYSNDVSIIDRQNMRVEVNIVFFVFSEIKGKGGDVRLMGKFGYRYWG